MWISRRSENSLHETINSLNNQVVILRGARQVGKTAFIERCLEPFNHQHIIRVNLLHATTSDISGKRYYGRDFFGVADDGNEFLTNIRRIAHGKPTFVFIDECDRYPLVMEAIQNLAQYSDDLRFILTGSNLENISPKNAATGRKKYFDLYPISFKEFLAASGDQILIDCLEQTSIADLSAITDYFHSQLHDRFSKFIRLGGMPRILTSFLTGDSEATIASIVQDLTTTIEENVKAILGDKIAVYQYHDFLRILCRHSLDTLKYARLQASHVSRTEAKRLVAKTVGARVAHKIRLWDSDKDLSKYVLFDSGIANYLLAGSSLLSNRLVEKELAILYETAICNALILSVPSRDDVMYWKSENRAEVEFVMRSPQFAGIDVKSSTGALRSLASMAVYEPSVECLVKISSDRPHFYRNYEAKSFAGSRNLPLIQIPHYLCCELIRLLNRENGATATV